MGTMTNEEPKYQLDLCHEEDSTSKKIAWIQFEIVADRVILHCSSYDADKGFYWDSDSWSIDIEFDEAAILQFLELFQTSLGGLLEKLAPMLLEKPLDAPYALKRFAKEHDIPWCYWFSGEPREDTRFWQKRYEESPEYAEQVDIFKKLAQEINEAQGAKVVEPNPDGLGLRAFVQQVD